MGLESTMLDRTNIEQSVTAESLIDRAGRYYTSTLITALTADSLRTEAVSSAPWYPSLYSNVHVAHIEHSLYI